MEEEEEEEEESRRPRVAQRQSQGLSQDQQVHRGSYMRAHDYLMILHECSCFIEFIKLVAKKR